MLCIELGRLATSRRGACLTARRPPARPNLVVFVGTPCRDSVAVRVAVRSSPLLVAGVVVVLLCLELGHLATEPMRGLDTVLGRRRRRRRRRPVNLRKTSAETALVSSVDSFID